MKTLNRRLKRLVICFGALLAIVVMLAAFSLSDRNWEQAWKDRIRVETPRGSEKEYVLSWIDRHCDFQPYVDEVCADALNNISITTLAGIEKSAVNSYAHLTVRRTDLMADANQDHMRIYYFFNADDEVIGHYYLPFHELAKFERSFQLLASR